MALSASDLREVARTWSRRCYQKASRTATMTDDDVQDAAAVVDTQLDTFMANLTPLLPEPFKSTATAEEREIMVATVAERRSGAAVEKLRSKSRGSR